MLNELIHQRVFLQLKKNCLFIIIILLISFFVFTLKTVFYNFFTQSWIFFFTGSRDFSKNPLLFWGHPQNPIPKNPLLLVEQWQECRLKVQISSFPTDIWGVPTDSALARTSGFEIHIKIQGFEQNPLLFLGHPRSLKKNPLRSKK